MRAPCCDPTATISAPSLATPLSTWVMPRVLPAAVKSPPARVAGGNPSAAGGGACPWWLLFAPAMTATTSPTTIMVRIGTITLSPAPRNRSAARNSASQLRLAGPGRSERTRPLHSACAPPCGTRLLSLKSSALKSSAPNRPGLNGSGPEVRGRASNSKPGSPSQTGEVRRGPVSPVVQPASTGSAWPGGAWRRWGLARWELVRWGLAVEPGLRRAGAYVLMARQDPTRCRPQDCPSCPSSPCPASEACCPASGRAVPADGTGRADGLTGTCAGRAARRGRARRQPRGASWPGPDDARVAW